MKLRVVFLSSLVLLCSLSLVAQDWPQWAFNAQHTGLVSVAGQNLNQNLVNTVYDPLVPQEMAATGGDLLAHYQSPLVDGSNVYMMFKSGTFDPNDYSTQTWGETKYTWSGTSLNVTWQFTTDWKAPGSLNDFWEAPDK